MAKSLCLVTPHRRCLLGIYLKGNKRKLLSLGTQVKCQKKSCSSELHAERGRSCDAISLPSDTTLPSNLMSKGLLKRGAKYVVVQGLPLTGCLPLPMMLTWLVDEDPTPYSRRGRRIQRAC